MFIVHYIKFNQLIFNNIDFQFFIKSDFNILIPFLLVKVGRFFGTFTDLSYICSEV